MLLSITEWPLIRKLVHQELPGQQGSNEIQEKDHFPRYSRSAIYQFHLLNLHSLLNMAPPSKLAVATSVVRRLVKEEASYHKELEQQEARIKKLEGDMSDQNAEFQLKQEVRNYTI
jgi:hypothetical protein